MNASQAVSGGDSTISVISVVESRVLYQLKGDHFVIYKITLCVCKG